MKQILVERELINAMGVRLIEIDDDYQTQLLEDLESFNFKHQHDVMEYGCQLIADTIKLFKSRLNTDKEAE